MCRQGINRHFFLLLVLSFLLQSACASAQVLGLPRREAAELLRGGNADFIRQANLPNDFQRAASRLKELLVLDPAAPFYAALMISDDPQLQMLLFCAALESPSAAAAREAAGQLIPLILLSYEEREVRNILQLLGSGSLRRQRDGHLTSLRAACLYRLGRYGEAADLFARNSPVSEWDRALSLFAAWNLLATENLESPRAESIRQEIYGLLFGENQNGDLLRWVQRQVHSSRSLFDTQELAVLSARLLNPGDYARILFNFSLALADGGEIFFRYPELIADLGRAYQFTPPMRAEGARLFRSWNTLLETGLDPGGDFPEIMACINSLDEKEIKSRHFYTLFYTGRIERARGAHAESSNFFWQALKIAPNALQSDACIWYLLMNAQSRGAALVAPLALETMPRWNDMSYFDDVLERLASHLTARRQWDTLLEVFNALERKGAGGAALSQYAWILGRAAEEGYLRTERRPESFFRAAFENERGTIYYRTMAASKLGASFRPESRGSQARLRNRSEELNFLLGFFENGAASFAVPFIRAREGELSVAELRVIAEAQAASGRYRDSLNLVSRYLRRENHEISRQDLYLFYPRPYREPIERYAAEMEIGLELLYALIRTESFFDHTAVSRVGATGLTQLMPAIAEEMAGRIFREGGPDYRGSGLNLTDPEINIHMGSFYLRRLNELLENPMLALLAYNGGMGRVRRWLAADIQQGALPLDLFLETIEYRETREYGRLLLGAAAIYGHLYFDKSMREVAAEIFG